MEQTRLSQRREKNLLSVEVDAVHLVPGLLGIVDRVVVDKGKAPTPPWVRSQYSAI